MGLVEGPAVFGQCCKEYGVGGSAAEGVVGPTMIEEGEVSGEAGPHVGDALLAVEVDLFVLDRAPEPFDEDVVPPAALAVHADLNLVRAQHGADIGALYALVDRDDRWHRPVVEWW